MFQKRWKVLSINADSLNCEKKTNFIVELVVFSVLNNFFQIIKFIKIKEFTFLFVKILLTQVRFERITGSPSIFDVFAHPRKGSFS